MRFSEFKESLLVYGECVSQAYKNQLSIISDSSIIRLNDIHIITFIFSNEEAFTWKLKHCMLTGHHSLESNTIYFNVELKPSHIDSIKYFKVSVSYPYAITILERVLSQEGVSNLETFINLGFGYAEIENLMRDYLM